MSILLLYDLVGKSIEKCTKELAFAPSALAVCVITVLLSSMIKGSMRLHEVTSYQLW